MHALLAQSCPVQRAPCTAEGVGSDDIARLRVAFLNEKLSPTLLPHYDDLIVRIKQMTNEQACLRLSNYLVAAAVLRQSQTALM